MAKVFILGNRFLERARVGTDTRTAYDTGGDMGTGKKRWGAERC